VSQLDDDVLGVVRASSWPTLFDCAHRWEWVNVRGVRGVSGPRATVGTAIHAGTAVFDTARMFGQPGDVLEAVDAGVAALHAEGEQVQWDDTFNRSSAEKWVVRLVTAYCHEVAPQREYIAVEIMVPALDIGTRHGVVRTTGTIDRIRKLADGRSGVSDLKSGGATVTLGADGKHHATTDGHHLQLGIYTIMAEVQAGIRLDAPAEIVGLQTTGKGVVATGEIADVKTPMLGDGQDVGLIDMAGQMLATGLFPPNPKSTLCSNTYCPAWAKHCKYRG